MCGKLHKHFNGLQIYHFPFDLGKILHNGIYILFEKGEVAHGTNRIVRIGTHTGDNQLRYRLNQHFTKKNKDRSIFRKNIGRSILSQNNDPFLDQWNIDLTSRASKAKYADSVDFDYQKEIEGQVTEYIQKNFFFVVFQVDDKETRLTLESRIISTVSLCKSCRPSNNWLGLSSPKPKIREAGLWLENELFKTPFSEEEFNSFM